jgi:hypothetical protein
LLHLIRSLSPTTLIKGALESWLGRPGRLTEDVEVGLHIDLNHLFGLAMDCSAHSTNIVWTNRKRIHGVPSALGSRRRMGWQILKRGEAVSSVGAIAPAFKGEQPRDATRAALVPTRGLQ